MLIDIFVRIENSFKRLESYTEVPPTPAMTDVSVKVMIEVLSILAIATEEINLGRSSELMLIKIHKMFLAYFLTFLGKIARKLLGRSDIEDALKKLDTLTMEEARMAITQTLNVTHKVDNKVSVLLEGRQETLEVTKKVDDKVSILITGGQLCVIFGHPSIPEH